MTGTNPDISISFKPGQTWREIMIQLGEQIPDLGKYDRIGFKYSGCGEGNAYTDVKISGQGVPDKTIRLIGIDVCEPAVAGIFLGYRDHMDLLRSGLSEEELRAERMKRIRGNQ